MAEQDEKALYEWQAGEFTTNEVGSFGWWGVGGFLVLAAAWTIWMKQWMGLAVVIMIGVMVWLVRGMKPRKFDHQLTEVGVKVGSRVYPYNTLKSFWIVLDTNVRTVNLLPDKKFGFLLTLQLGDANVDKVRETLAKFLPEDASRGEDTVDKIGRFFRL
jgi:hypothetical protein